MRARPLENLPKAAIPAFEAGNGPGRERDGGPTERREGTGERAAHALSPSMDRTRVLAELQDRIAAIEASPTALLEAPNAGREEAEGPSLKEQNINKKSESPRASLGCPRADARLGGGFPASGLSELRLDETRDGGGGAGFALALAARFGVSPSRPLIWIGEATAFAEAGLPYAPGLAGFGLDPAALLLVRTKKLDEAVWAAEEAAASPAPAAVILEARGNPARLGLEGTRRLHWRARAAGRPVLLLRDHALSQTSAAPLRLAVRSAPGPRKGSAVADLADRPRLVGRPGFVLTLEKTRSGRSGALHLEWDRHERRFATLDRSAPVPLPGRDASPAFDRPDPADARGSVVAFERAS